MEVILSCRLLLNLRGVHGSTTSQPRWGSGPPKWSDSTKVPTNPSVSNPGPGDPTLRSTELTMFNSSAVKLEPNRRVVKEQKSFDIREKSGWNDV